MRLHPRSHIEDEASHPCARQERESCRLQSGPHGTAVTSATTSNRRSSALSGTPMSRSPTATLTETRPPASRQTRAAALSKANPRRPNTPTFAHAPRWWPRASMGTRRGRKREPQTAKEQDAEHLGIEPAVKRGGTTGEGKARKRTTLRTDQCLRSVREAGPNGGDMKKSSTFSIALNCHPCWCMPGPPSSREFASGRTPSANASQLGALNPTSSRRFLALTTPARW